MDGVAFVRMDAVNGVDAIVQDFKAFGVVEFCAEEVGVTAANFRTEDPVHARGDSQVFVRAVQELEGVGSEYGDCSLAVVGCTDVELTVAELVVADFDTETANALVTGNGGVTARIAPEIIVECTCVVGQVTEYEAHILERLPAEFHAVEVECGVAVFVASDGG